MLSNFARRLLNRTISAKRRLQSIRHRRKALLSVESLEDRRLLAFTTPMTYPVGNNPAGIAVADFNADGRDDMAIVLTGASGAVSVMLSNSDGSFAPKVDYPAGANAFDATAGDMNADGKLDLVIVGSAVDVLLGNGDGTFASPIEYPVTASAHSIEVGDFNNDGRLDVGTMNVNSASVLLGNGDGSLQAPMTTPVAGNNINLVTGDFNHDGNLDMATSNTNSVGTVNVLRGHGDGSFDPYSSYYAFTAPVYLASGDFNEDGYIDFACPNSYAATSMSILLNNGDGTYGAPHTYGIAQTGYEIEVDDFNNDGHDDFAVRGGSKYMISHGKGDGTFYPSVDFATPSGRFEAGTHGDFNGDGASDLAYPTASGVTVVTNDNADAQNRAGAVTFKVTAPATTTSRSVLPMTITAVDANGDTVTGFRGLVYISSSDPLASTASGYAFNPADAGIPYLFTAADAGTHAFTGAIRLVTGGDQTVTVAAPQMTASTVTVNVTGQVKQLSVAVPPTAVAGDTFNITVKAIDTAGVTSPGYTSTVRFTSSDTLAGLPADYTFTPEDGGSHTFTVTLKSSGPRFINVQEVGGTINGGATVNVTPQSATKFTLAGAAGAIGVSRPFSISARDPYGNVATSYNGTVHFTSSDAAAILPTDTVVVNGIATVNVKFLTVGIQSLTATDIANASLTGTITSDATPPVANSFRVSDYPSTVAGNSNDFTVTVIDTIGQVASGFTGTIFFSSSDLKAGLPASYTFTTEDAGVHRFAATLKTAGNQSISVRDYSGALTGTQSGISVVASEFSKFSLSVPNGADSKGHMLVQAGETISLKVRAVDIYGNSTSNYIGTIGFASSDATAILPGNYTFSLADAGEHTFPVELRTSTVNGQVSSFTVVDVANPVIQATQTNFEVMNAEAAIFKVSLPTKGIAGDTITAKVTAVDAYGNLAKNYFGTVHLLTSSSNASLPGDYSFDSVDLGVHDFDLALNTSGIQSLTIVDINNNQVLGTTTIGIEAADATSLSLSMNNTATAGTLVTVAARALDAFGNIATSYRGTTVFSSSDSRATLPSNFTFGNKQAGFEAFTVTFKSAGLQSLTLSDEADSNLVTTISGINVSPATTVGSFAVSGFPASTAGATASFTIKVLDSYGNPMNNYLGTVNLSSSDTQAGLPASYSFTDADQGTHTFNATLKTAGTHTITVRDSVTSAAVGSQTGIVVTPSTVASVSISGANSTTAGVAQSYTVSVKDAFGNIVPSYTGTVQFSSSDTKATLPASYSFSSADAGSHTFSLVLKSAGQQSISVKELTGTLAATQAGITVNAAAAATFQVSAPATAIQGSAFSMTITALDAYGNIAKGYQGKISFSSPTDSKGSKGSYSFSGRDAGVATVKISFGSVGLQTLRIVDSSNSLSVSVTINVLSKK